MVKAMRTSQGLPPRQRRAFRDEKCVRPQFAGGVGVHLLDVLARFSAGDDSITVRTPCAFLSSCYCAAMDSLLLLGPQDLAPTTDRRLRSRAALDSMLGSEPSALISPRRLSMRATAYDSYQIGRIPPSRITTTPSRR